MALEHMAYAALAAMPKLRIESNASNLAVNRPARRLSAPQAFKDRSSDFCW